MKLYTLLRETREEDIQLLIDLLSDMSPTSDRYKKYYSSHENTVQLEMKNLDQKIYQMHTH